MSAEKQNNIILMGVKHCGKSTIGKLLADTLNWNFYDLDDLLEAEYHPQRVYTFREIFKTRGKEFFSQLEAAAARRHSTRLKQGQTVLALGGSTIENRDAMAHLETCGVFVFLKEEKEILFQRIQAGGLPPFLSKDDPYGDFSKLYEHRSQLYNQKADLVIELQNRPVDEAVRALLQLLKENHYAG